MLLTVEVTQQHVDELGFGQRLYNHLIGPAGSELGHISWQCVACDTCEVEQGNYIIFTVMWEIEQTYDDSLILHLLSQSPDSFWSMHVQLEMRQDDHTTVSFSRH